MIKSLKIEECGHSETYNITHFSNQEVVNMVANNLMTAFVKNETFSLTISVEVQK